MIITLPDVMDLLAHNLLRNWSRFHHDEYERTGARSAGLEALAQTGQLDKKLN
jgi:hypothetical protein